MDRREEGRSRLSDAIAALSVRAIRLYQWAAPGFVRGCCRFEPTCSHYGIEAIGKYGPWVGWRKTIARICRCYPPHGGVDRP